MKKQITVSQFAEELLGRIDKNKGIECCKEEIKNLVALAAKEMGSKMIEVEWQD